MINRVRSLTSMALLMFAGLAVPCWAQKAPADPSSAAWDVAPPPTRLIDKAIDSGWVSNDAAANLAGGEGRMLVFATDLFAEGSAWVRARFENVVLAGDPEAENGSILVVRSLQDGAVQYLNADHVRQWANTTAYFNGPIVRVELWAAPGTGLNRVAIAGLTADDPSQRVGDVPSLNDICGPTDDRTLSTDNRQGRLMSVGCTGWMFNDTNNQFLTAGHCAPAAGQVMQFNVPLSSAGGALINPPPEDQYAVEAASAQAFQTGPGNDYSYFGVFANSNTGLMPIQRYGQGAYTLANAPASAAGVNIRITGYGSTNTPVSPTFNQVQKTHTGLMSTTSTTVIRYTVDTTGGNSGSPVFNENTGVAIGIHTHAGCTGSGNQGTAVQQTGFTAFRNNPLGLCRSGLGTVGGTIYALGDNNNNFGTLRVAPSNFAKVSQVGNRWQGMAFDAANDRFLGINSARELHAIARSTGVATLLGPVTGTAQTLTGLGFDQLTGTLYAMAPATGQLFSINTATLAASAVGAAQGGSVRAIDFDQARRVLWGIDTSGSVRLVQINTTSGVRTVIGPLGGSIASAPDLVADPSDLNLYTINPANGQLVRINPATGAGTVLGATNGSFGSAYGLASSAALPLVPTLVIVPPMTLNDVGGNGNGNGRIDPGETSIALTIPVINAGSNATGIVATLSSLTPGVTVVNAVANYPNLATSASGGNATPFRIAVDQSVACGSTINLRLSYSAAEGSGSSDTAASVGSAGGVGTPQTFSYTTPVVAIPDNPAPGVSAFITLPNIGTIADLDFRFDGTACSAAIGSTTVGLDHTFVGDLLIELTSPAATNVVLVNRAGGSGNNFCNTVFNDDGPFASIQTIIAAGNPFSGSFLPANVLSAFDGQSAAGQWRLRVTDLANVDVGSIRRFSLVVTPVLPPVCQPPIVVATCMVDFNSDGFLNQEDLGGFLTAFLDESVPAGPSGTGVAPCPGEPTPYDTLGYAADFNRDCTFNQEDLSGFLTEYLTQVETPNGCVPG